MTKTGPSAAQRGRSEAAVDGAWTLEVQDILPVRIATRAVFNVEDASRLVGLEDALRRDLSALLVERIDRSCFVGDSGANETRANITGLTTHADVTEVTLEQSEKVAYADWMKMFAGMIDGISAASQTDLMVILTVGSNTLLMSTVANTNRNETVGQVLRANGINWNVRGSIEANTAAADFGGFVGLARGIDGAAVAALWETSRLIRDEVTGAASGTGEVDLQSQWGFELPRPQNFRRIKYVA